MSDEKKLFHGVTAEEMAERKRQAEESAKTKAEESAKKKAEEERNAAYGKYVHLQPLSEIPSKRSYIIENMGFAIFMLIIWCFCAFGTAYITEGPNLKEDAKVIKQRLRDNVWPISNGWYTEIMNPIGEDNSPEGWRGVYEYSENAKGKFLPRGIWYMNMAFLLVTIWVEIGTFKASKKRLAENRAHNASVMSKYQTDKDTVDMMLELKKFGQQYNLNTNQVKKLVKSATSIISRMSSDERVYFDMLLNGKLDNINDKETLMKMATAIMSGHLQKHPEDMKLVMEIYDINSIPKEIIQKYGQYQY